MTQSSRTFHVSQHHRDQISEENENGLNITSNIDLDGTLAVNFLDEIHENQLENGPISGYCDFDNLSDAAGSFDTLFETDPSIQFTRNEIRGFGETPEQISISTTEKHLIDIKTHLFNNKPDSNQYYSFERKTSSVELSQSVGIGFPQNFRPNSHTISIENDLEETFRARYKSDYFAMSGKNRKPRYVADRNGNHFITLKIPVGLTGRIRVDWLTTEISKDERYRMPYRFQVDNDSTSEPDQNPIYLDIPENQHGSMKLFLVLIKATQGELKSAQPLEQFQPWFDAFGVESQAVKHSLLTPKDLIQKFKLNQSQLAFTYCSVSEDRRNNYPEWDTTVYSSVLTELPPESSKQKTTVKCPNCCHEFDINEQQDPSTNNNESMVNAKRKTKTATISSNKRKNQNHEIHFEESKLPVQFTAPWS